MIQGRKYRLRAIWSLVMPLIERLTRNYLPTVWQRQKYYSYADGIAGEREIKIVHLFIDRQRAALDVGVHFGMYARHSVPEIELYKYTMVENKVVVVDSTWMRMIDVIGPTARQ
jgi:hypothetical protein